MTESLCDILAGCRNCPALFINLNKADVKPTSEKFIPGITCSFERKTITNTDLGIEDPNSLILLRTKINPNL